MTALRILHLYPTELGINGDVGNVTALQRRAAWAGIETDVRGHQVGDRLPDAVDIVHIGSGPLSAQRSVYDDVLRIAPQLRALHRDGAIVLAIAAGWQLLGSHLVLPDGTSLTGGGVFPSRATLVARRTVGESVLGTADGDVVGFQNHSAVVELESGALPFGVIRAGAGADGSAGADDNLSATESTGARPAEGVRLGESIGTHLHGALLPLNPCIADRMLRAAAARAGLPFDSDALARATHEVDGYATEARRAIAARVHTTVTT